MTDRSSSVNIGAFLLSVDRDHRGRFRGDQAMSAEYRGWHYHIEHPQLSQDRIFDLLSKALEKTGACKSEDTIYVGTAERAPKRYELWCIDEFSTVLWISSVTGSLHIEANKKDEYAKNILTKPVLIKILKQYDAEMKLQKPLEFSVSNSSDLHSKKERS